MTPISRIGAERNVIAIGRGGGGLDGEFGHCVRRRSGARRVEDDSIEVW